MSEIRDHTSCVLPILIHKKIHYNIMKTIYRASYRAYNVCHKLFGTPVVYGIWHPHKYTVAVTYRLFFPLMVAFSHGTGSRYLGVCILQVDLPEAYAPMFVCVYLPVEDTDTAEAGVAMWLVPSPNVGILECRSATRSGTHCV